MNWKVNILGKDHEVFLPREIVHGEIYEARVGKNTYKLKYNAITHTFKVFDLESVKLSQSFAIRNKKLQKFDGDPVTTVNLEINATPGISFEAKVKPNVPGEAGRAGSKSTKGSATRSPITGKVLKVFVEAGKLVNEGDTLLIIEAMKMENKIFATQSGVVAGIKVKEGDAVTVGKELLSIKEVGE